jgi:uncharacterized protein YeaO (DUF488 family)
MPLIVHTARMGFKGADWLDITRKGAKERPEPGGHRGMGAAFAPSDQLLREFLRKRQSRPDGETDREWLEYCGRYTDEMRKSYVAARESWNRLLALDHVVCLCYCVEQSRCHRVVLARDLLTKMGAKYMGEL